MNDKEIKEYYTQKSEQIFGASKVEIFGVFSFGDANFDLANSKEDLKGICIILPTQKELYYKIKYEADNMGKPKFSHPMYENFYMVDIRELDNINILIQVLYAKHSMVNRKYENFYERLLSSRERIFYSDPFLIEKRITNIIDDYLSTEDPHDAMMAAIFNNILQAYPYSTVFHNKLFMREPPLSYLLDIKQGKIEIDVDKMKQDIASAHKMVIKNAIEMITKNGSPDEAALPFNEIFEELMTFAIGQVTNPNVVASFVRSLKEKEKIILRDICEQNKITPYYSILSSIDRTNIRNRDTYVNVIKKLKEYELAEIESHGKKGTLIVFKNPALMEMIINELYKY